MRTTLFCLILSIISLGAYTAKNAFDRANDVLRTLGVPEPIAKDCIFSSFSGLYLSYPDAGPLKRTPRSDRAGIVQQIGDYAKAYTASDEFKKKYLEYRDNQKPSPPEAPKSVDQMKKENRESMQKSIKETEESMKSASGDVRATLNEVLVSMKEQLKSIDDPNNPMYSKEMDNMMKQGYEQEMVNYREKVAQWEKDVPLSPTPMVKKWLTKFLEVSKGVDYSAQLAPDGHGKMVFVKPEYENQTAEWKMCFRAGKETVEAGRAYASKWLKEIESVR